MQPAGFPARPRAPATLPTGSRAIQVQTNHFRVQLSFKGDIYHYDISVQSAAAAQAAASTAPPAPPRAVPAAVHRRIVRSLLVASPFASIVAVTDWNRNVFTTTPLLPDFVVPNLLPFGETPPPAAPAGAPGAAAMRGRFNVHVRLVDTKRTAQLDALLRQQLNYTPYDVLQALDVALRYAVSIRSDCVVRGPNVFPMSAQAQPLGQGVECWTGFHQSVRPTQSGLTVNVDRAFAAYYRHMPLLEFCNELLGGRGGGSGSRGGRRGAPASSLWSPAQTRRLSQSLSGLSVEVTHRPNATRRVYRVNALTPKSATEISFNLDTGASMTVAAFFAQQYQRLQHPELPCVHVGARNRQVYLPMEVCVVAARQRCLGGRLSDQQTTQMLRVACVAPVQRRRDIETIMQDHIVPRVPATRDPVLPTFGLVIEPRMIATEAFVLPEPKIQLGDSKTSAPMNGAWRLDKLHKFYRCAQLRCWAVVDFTDGGRSSLAPAKLDAFVKALQAVLARRGVMGAGARQPVVLTKRSFPRGESTRSLFERALQKQPEPVQLVLCVLPARDSQLYGEIKCASDLHTGVISQCVLERHVVAAKDAYLNNLVLKVHAKIGGINFVLERPPCARIFSAPVLICGADVSHPAPSSDESVPSIAAVVCSLDRFASAHAVTYRAQGARVEQIEALQEMMVQLLQQFYRVNQGRKPQRIVFYRDGVSEGQFAMVQQHEIPAIRRACTQLEPGYMPALTMVVIQKRHHTRLFPTSDRDSDRKTGNVPAGTVVDSGICHPREFDYYLMSHGALQGTSRPCHYHVLHDDNAFGSHELQQLTFALCYLFVRCTRSVSMVPAAYYAHLVAFRARFYWSQSNQTLPPVHAELQKHPQRLFYV